jgi:hypothetical protein
LVYLFFLVIFNIFAFYGCIKLTDLDDVTALMLILIVSLHDETEMIQ